MQVVCTLGSGQNVCKLEMSTPPCIDLSFEHEKKFYKVSKVETKVPKNPEDEKSFNCTVFELTQEQHQS